jgi:hypothetical protein
MALRIPIWTTLAFFGATGICLPGVAFPFNSQVPTVARVGQPYDFQFSASTFVPDTSNFTYSLSDQPGWLLLDSATRTLTGAPSQADIGTSSFTITAADITGAAHMACVMIVSKDPPPQMEWSIAEQLAATANLSSSDPPVVTILPSSPFKFDFRQDSFIDIVQRKLSYYATLSDHTSLPAWLIFDDQSLSFSGTAPELSAFPQSWSIDFIASDVEGFAGSGATFTLAIGTQQLVFVPEYQEVNITEGQQLEFDGLADTLYLNGDKKEVDSLQSAEASVPSWLDFDSATLKMTGTVPDEPTDVNITVTVTDSGANRATAVVRLSTRDGSLFASSVPTLTAYYGRSFTYHFSDSLFSSPDVQLSVVLPTTATWLHFDSATRTLSGDVPSDTAVSEVQGTIKASLLDSATPGSQTFTIELQPPASEGSSSSKVTPRTSSTSTASSRPTSTIVTGSQHHLSTRAVAGIITGTVVAATIVAVLLVCCWRRRRQVEGYVEAESPRKRTISRPLLPPDAGTIAVTTDMQTDVEKHPITEAPIPPPEREREPPPQIALDIPTQQSNRRMKWSKRFSRISHASSIGFGEEAIRADSNIPEPGRESVALHTPHDSFSVPMEIARSSRQMSEISPSKRALRRLQGRQPLRDSVGLGIDTGGAMLLPRHSSRGAGGRRRNRNSTGQSTIMDRCSVASMSTRGTSVLSTKPSDFLRPPTRSTMTLSRSIPNLALTDAEKRKSIRMVAKSDSTLDARSLHEKRQSFIRNRASTSLASPLFAHGSRAPSDPRQNGHSSVAGSVTGSSRRSKRVKSQLTSYSESSSLEPPPRDPRRLSARVRSAFAPSFPRAITRSSLGADEADGEAGDASSDYYSTSSSITESDLAAEMALPKHQRSWVLPGEASPTPPPAPPTSRQASSGRARTPSDEYVGPRQRWKERLREQSSSPLSTAVAVPINERSPKPGTVRAVQNRRSRINEPLNLVSNDSLSRAKQERPRLIHTNSKRPVSVEKVQRLSSLKAETEDTRPGSEMYEAMSEAGLMSPPVKGEKRDGTQRSNMSGPAFL